VLLGENDSGMPQQKQRVEVGLRPRRGEKVVNKSVKRTVIVIRFVRFSTYPISPDQELC